MINIQPLTESSLLITFGSKIDPQLSLSITSACAIIRQKFYNLILDMVPSYTTIHITYRLEHPLAETLPQSLLALLQETTKVSTSLIEADLHQIPVYFGKEVALDLESVSLHSGLDPERVIEIFCQGIYRVYAVGFSPNFAYLGMIPKQLQIPRLQTPRACVPEGSVAIADRQTAVYPSESPGGWRLIGRTPHKYSPSEPGAVIFQVGDNVRFTAIDQQTFLSMGGHLP